MQKTPIRNQGNTIEIRIIAPMIDELVPANMRRESVNRVSKSWDVGKVNQPPSRLSIVSISTKRSARPKTSYQRFLPLEKRFIIRPRG